MEIGDKVIVTGEIWKGEVGEYTCDENTLVGLRHKVELDNGFSGLFSRKDLIVISHST